MAVDVDSLFPSLAARVFRAVAHALTACSLIRERSRSRPLGEAVSLGPLQVDWTGDLRSNETFQTTPVSAVCAKA